MGHTSIHDSMRPGRQTRMETKDCYLSNFIQKFLNFSFYLTLWLRVFQGKIKPRREMSDLQFYTKYLDIYLQKKSFKRTYNQLSKILILVKFGPQQACNFSILCNREIIWLQFDWLMLGNKMKEYFIEIWRVKVKVVIKAEHFYVPHLKTATKRVITNQYVTD